MEICVPVSYTHLRAHETDSYLVCRLLLEKKIKIRQSNTLQQITAEKRLSRSTIFDYKSCSRVAEYGHVTLLAPFHLHVNEHHVTQLLASLSLPIQPPPFSNVHYPHMALPPRIIPKT